MTTPRQPWMKFYPADWRADEKLRMCSLAARGLWVEMLALMWRAQPIGHMTVNGKAPTDAQLAALAGAPPDQIPDLIGELETAGVFSRTAQGVIYSRRMTRDAKKARISVKNGKAGGNPTLLKQRGNPGWDNPQDKAGDKAQKPEARGQKPEREDPPPPDPIPPRPREPDPPAIGGGGGDARASPKHDPDAPEIEALTQQAIHAAGVDLTRDVTGRWAGSAPRMVVAQWRALGLSPRQIVEEVRRTKPRDGPPSSLAYWTPAMRRLAGLAQATAPAPTPAQPPITEAEMVDIKRSRARYGDPDAIAWLTARGMMEDAE